jgi:hypothetical protein
MIEATPDTGTWSPLGLVVAIEVARREPSAPKMPSFLETWYDNALTRIPSIVAKICEHSIDDVHVRICSAAIAASQGSRELAAAILEMEPELVTRVLNWSNGLEESSEDV